MNHFVPHSEQMNRRSMPLMIGAGGLRVIRSDAPIGRANHPTHTALSRLRNTPQSVPGRALMRSARIAARVAGVTGKELP
jgi:hypothetical protein